MEDNKSMKEVVSELLRDIGGFEDNPDDVLFLQLTQRELIIAIASMRALSSFLGNYADDEQLENFNGYVHALLEKIEGAISAQKEL